MKRSFILTLFVLHIQIISAMHLACEYTIPVANIQYELTFCSEKYTADLENGGTLIVQRYTSGPYTGKYAAHTTNGKGILAHNDKVLFDAVKLAYCSARC